MPKSNSTSSGQTEVGFNDDGRPYTYKLKRGKKSSNKSTSSGQTEVGFNDDGRPYTYKLKKTRTGKGIRRTRRIRRK